uniref:Uncharacterized protein n=1 Tax=virus sp. ctJLD79 TaxID=2827987 RepID=A0A8S5RF32_9VIRU|nr:MAG TPA: hypothetical protein [virus sp. ctJLD79]
MSAVSGAPISTLRTTSGVSSYTLAPKASSPVWRFVYSVTSIPFSIGHALQRAVSADAVAHAQQPALQLGEIQLAAGAGAHRPALGVAHGGQGALGGAQRKLRGGVPLRPQLAAHHAAGHQAFCFTIRVRIIGVDDEPGLIEQGAAALLLLHRKLPESGGHVGRFRVPHGSDRRLGALDVQGLGLGHLQAVDLAALHGGCADVLAGAGQILQMHGHLPLHDPVAPVGMAADELGGGLFAGDPGGGLIVHVIGLQHVEARGLTDNAQLNELLGEISLLDEALVLHQHLHELRGRDEEASRGGDALAAEHPLGLQHQLVGVGLGGGGLGGADGGAVGALQRGDGLLVDGQAQAVARAVQPVGHNAVRHAGGVIAVDQLIDRLILVDVQIQIGGGARLRVDAPCLVIGLDGHLGVPHRDLHLAGGGVALIAAVEDQIVLGHQSVAQLGVHQLGPALLIGMCHKKLPLFRLLHFQFGVQLPERGHDAVVLLLPAAGVGLTAVPHGRIARPGELQNCLRLRGAVLLALAAQQAHRHAGGGRHLVPHRPDGIGPVHRVHLRLKLRSPLQCPLELTPVRLLSGVELLGLGLDGVVVGVLSALPRQPVPDDGIHLGLGKGALLPLLLSGGVLLIHSFVH